MKDAFKTFTIKFRSLIILASALMLALVSCTSDNNEDMENMVTLYPVIGTGIETVINTRATTITLNGTNYSDSIPDGTSISIYAVPNDNTQPVIRGRFTRRNSRWSSTVGVKSGYSYSLYGHSPADIPGSNNLDFDRQTTRIHFYNLDIITTQDPWVSVAVRSEVVTEDVTTPQTITRDNFDIGLVGPIPEETPKRVRKVWMAMDHLYAKATISFRLVPQYDALRTIRLLDARIKTNKSRFIGECSYYFAGQNAGLSLQSTGTTSNFAEIDLINGVTANDSINRLPELPDTVVLSPDTLQFAWFCFLPVQSKLPDDLYLEVSYDVMHGDSIIRGNQTARNKLPLSSMMNPQAGHNYKITIDVDPSYLYVLCDDDADEEIKIKSSIE